MASPLATVSPPRLSRQRFSAELREKTGQAHHDIDSALNLDLRLSSRVEYFELLDRLRGFYSPLEAALADVRGWHLLSPPVNPKVCRRAPLLDEDLSKAGPIFPPADRARYQSPSRIFEAGSLAGALGCYYVLEGSALGGRVVARRARQQLGQDLPVAFLTTSRRANLGADWLSLRATLDSFPDEFGRSAALEAITAARATFHELGAWLGRGGSG